jgi:hypothetical protein
MANGIDINQAVSVRNTVHHAPLTHSDTPEVASALKFYDPGRTGIRHQRLDLFEDAPCNLGIEIL